MVALLLHPDGHWPDLPNLATDWVNFTYYGLCFAIGAGIAAWLGFETRLYSEAPRLLVLMLLAFAGVVLCGESTAGRRLVGLTAWCGIGASLELQPASNPPPPRSLGTCPRQRCRLRSRHHLILLLIGILVLPSAMPGAAQIILIWLSATAASLAAMIG